MKKRRLLSVSLTFIMLVSLLPAFSINASATGGPSITLDAGPTFAFDDATLGYSNLPVNSVNITNEGTAATGELAITLSGTNANSFALSKVSISDLAAGATDSIDVNYKAGLPVGTYTATVTVSGSSVTSKSLDVSFTVNPVETYKATIRTFINEVLSDATGGVTLQNNTSAVTATKTDTGIYTADVENGSYNILVGGVYTQQTLTISGADCIKSLEYYTVSFDVSKSGTASDASISATANGVAIAYGAAVEKGSRVLINAVGTGAGSYTYAWTGAGTGSQITSEQEITPLNKKIEASCVVSGTGAQTENPDYKINGYGYTWSGSDETVVLSYDLNPEN